ncbi:hypothetical protein RSX20_002578 [Salmonella enterica]|nr:hypothetical protein [Salmonella enterica]ELL0968585.1 hypothetical protein [Salmonella enterica]
MSKLTFVIEFEDGKEPPVHAHMEAFGGKVVAVAFRDALEEPEEIKTLSLKDDWVRCLICNDRHPIGVACPFNAITSVVNHGKQT